MIVHYDDAPTPPACWNAEPIAPVRVDHVLNRQTGAIERVEIRNDWAQPGCKAWSGTGIGPNGERYPEAHGWKPWCLQCVHMPAEVVA